MSKKLSFSIIPDEVKYNKELTQTEKLIFGELLAISDEKGQCRATNSYFATMYGLHGKSISKNIAGLKKVDLITIVTDEEIVKKLKNKNLEGVGFGIHVCEWCKIFTSVIIGHHYPIKKSEGGTELVNICSNCHAEFHQVERVISIVNYDEIMNRIFIELNSGENE